VISPPFLRVRQLTCISEHKRCAGDSTAAGRVTHVGQFLSEVPQEVPWPSRLGVGHESDILTL
jgi:hypothetical protein